MADQRPSPLQSGFILTEQEKRSILVVCALFLIGLAARHYQQKQHAAAEPASTGMEQTEQAHE